MPGRLGRHRRLAIAASVLAALIGLVAVIVASGGGGGDGGASETRLLDSIPDSVQKNCEQPGNSWMKRHGAVEQQKCDPLPSGVPVGDLAYGLFPSADEAQAFAKRKPRTSSVRARRGQQLCSTMTTPEAMPSVTKTPTESSSDGPSGSLASPYS